MAAARVLLLLSGRPESVSFTQSVCGLLGARPGLGPWSAHCSLKRGQLVLSARPFPGASARLPLQVGRGGTQRGAVKGGTGIGMECEVFLKPVCVDSLIIIYTNLARLSKCRGRDCSEGLPPFFSKSQCVFCRYVS